MRLILVRHGETDWNTELRYQGHQPIALNARGRWQAQQAGLQLADVGAVALYASTLARAWESAHLIGSATGLVPQPQPFLHEINDGQWAGHTPEQLLQRFPEHMAAVAAAPDTTPRLDGESYAQLQTRMVAGFELLAARHPHATVLAVSHGGAIRALLCHVLGMPLAHVGRLWLDNGALAEIIAHGNGWRVLRINAAAHLAGGEFATGE